MASHCEPLSREKIIALEKNLCASSQPFKDEISEFDLDSQGDYCVTCELNPNFIVNLRKIVKVSAEQARLKREIEFLKYYRQKWMGKINLDSIPQTLEYLNQLKRGKDEVEERLANMGNVREAYVKNEAAIVKLNAGKELSEDEKRSLAKMFRERKPRKEDSPTSEDLFFKKISKFHDMPPPFKASPHLKYNSSPLPPPQNQSLPIPPPDQDLNGEENKPLSNLELLKSYKETQEALDKATRDRLRIPETIQEWLEASDQKPPAGISNRKIAKLLNDVNQDKRQEYIILKDQAEKAAEIVKHVEARLEELKEMQAQHGQLEKSSRAKFYTRSELTYLENTLRDRISIANPCGLSTAEMLAISYYTGSKGFRVLNGALRAGGTEAKDMEHFAETLKAALKKFRTFDGTVRRGAELPSEKLEEHQRGATVEYPAFTSTSVGSGFGALHRFTIKSKNGAYIAPYSANPHEREVIIPPGNFKVLSRERSLNGKIEFVLEQVD